jgi:hypothetical protein
MEVEASKSCRTWSSIGKGRPCQGLPGSIQDCQSHLTRRAVPWSWIWSKTYCSLARVCINLVWHYFLNCRSFGLPFHRERE